MKRFLLNFSYDGTFFKGWQKQEGLRTVQGELERVLKEVAKKPVRLFGAGRTDTKVHALNQFAHFDFEVNMNCNQIKMALNSKLPNDIYIKNVYAVSPDFNARFSAVAREYIYLVTNRKTPHNRFYKTYYPNVDIDLNKIEKYLEIFIGEYDFSAFARKNPDYKHYLSNVMLFDIKKENDTFVFRIKANRFLHNMVRRLVGTILFAIKRDIKPQKIKEILLFGEQNNEKIVTTAKPNGLYLANVIYNEEFYHYEDIFSDVLSYIF